MKTVVSSIGFFFLFVLPVFSELLPQDLNKIRLIVKEEISISEAKLNKRIDALETELKEEIAESEKHLKEYVDTKFEAVDTKFEAVDTKFEALQRQINLLVVFVSGLIILIVATIGIPQIIMAWRGKSERSQDEKIEALSREIEALKEQRIVNP